MLSTSKEYLQRDELIADLYLKEFSMSQIAKQLNISFATVWRSLNRQSIPARPPEISNRTYPIDHSMFKVIDSEIKAYWLGFLYADGCVVTSMPRVMLALAIKDKDHIIRYRNDLDIKNPIREIEKKPGMICGRYNAGGKQVIVTFSSSQIKKDLIKLGCVPAKSLILTFPTPDQVPDHLLHHFIRGHFDGDGCITGSQKKTRRQYTVLIASTRAFNEGTFRTIEQNIGYKGRFSTVGKICYLVYSSYDAVNAFGQYIYKNATVYLQRKHVLFETAKKEPPIASRAAGSPNHVRAKRISVKRIDTNKIFIISNIDAFTKTHPEYACCGLYQLASGKRNTYKDLTLAKSLI